MFDAHHRTYRPGLALKYLVPRFGLLFVFTDASDELF